MKGQDGVTTRGQEGGVMRGDAITSLHKTTRGRHSERTMRDVGSGDDDCSDNSNGNSNGMDADSGNGENGDDKSNSNSGGSDSNSGQKNNNQLETAAEKAVTAVDAALTSILLAS